MRDAFGGIVNLSFIVVFMVIVNGYLAFAANYNKAFRMKNKIISIVEQNEGYDFTNHSEIDKNIGSYMKQIGYAISNKNLSVKDYTCNTEYGFCVKEEKTDSGSEIVKKTYSIITFVNVDIPMLNKWLPTLSFFQVSGTTKAITQH